MGEIRKGQAARAEYAGLRMVAALKRTLFCNAADDYERAWRWASAWGVLARTCSPTACLKARKCRYRTDECP
jgi:hypothetical protein